MSVGVAVKAPFTSACLPSCFVPGAEDGFMLSLCSACFLTHKTHAQCTHMHVIMRTLAEVAGMVRVQIKLSVLDLSSPPP